MFTKTALVALVASQASAFPFVAEMVGRDPAEMKRADRLVARIPGDAASCPFNPDHKGAEPYSAKYPYCGAKNGAPGYQICANNKVPADGMNVTPSSNTFEC